MDKAITTIQDQIKAALDGRTQRWLSFRVGIPETELSKKMNGLATFSQDEVDNISKILKFEFKLK